MALRPHPRTLGFRLFLASGCLNCAEPGSELSMTSETQVGSGAETHGTGLSTTGGNSQSTFPPGSLSVGGESTFSTTSGETSMDATVEGGGGTESVGGGTWDGTSGVGDTTGADTQGQHLFAREGTVIEVKLDATYDSYQGYGCYDVPEQLEFQLISHPQGDGGYATEIIPRRFVCGTRLLGPGPTFFERASQPGAVQALYYPADNCGEWVDAYMFEVLNFTSVAPDRMTVEGAGIVRMTGTHLETWGCFIHFSGTAELDTFGPEFDLREQPPIRPHQRVFLYANEIVRPGVTATATTPTRQIPIRIIPPNTRLGHSSVGIEPEVAWPSDEPIDIHLGELRDIPGNRSPDVTASFSTYPREAINEALSFEDGLDGWRAYRPCQLAYANHLDVMDYDKVPEGMVIPDGDAVLRCRRGTERFGGFLRPGSGPRLRFALALTVDSDGNLPAPSFALAGPDRPLREFAIDVSRLTAEPGRFIVHEVELLPEEQEGWTWLEFRFPDSDRRGAPARSSDSVVYYLDDIRVDAR